MRSRASSTSSFRWRRATCARRSRRSGSSAATSAEAEEQARKALDLLGGRVDHLQEVGTAQLALGRALAAQGSLDEGEASIAAAEADVRAALESLGHRSYAWIAQGDVESRRGNDAGAASLYRRAARALRDPDASLAGQTNVIRRCSRRMTPLESRAGSELAAVEPAAAEAGEDAGDARRGHRGSRACFPW